MMPELNIRKFRPIKISDSTPTGLFLPHKPPGEVMLALNWEGKAYGMYLSGRPFSFFPVKAGITARGTLITDVEFLVDTDSRYDAVQQADPLGALVLSGGELYIIGVQLGDGFADPVDVPLWGEFEPGSAEEKVGFSRWAIVALEGDERVTLWSNDADGRSDEDITNVRQ